MCVRRFFFFLLNILGGVESLGSRMTQYDMFKGGKTKCVGLGYGR